MKNKVASMLKILAIFTWAAGLFAAGAIGGDWFTPVIYARDFSMTIFLAIVFAAFIGGLIIYAFGEIIALLHRIAANTEG